MTLELFAAGAMLVGLVIYALTGGADFGGGILDLFASGRRAQAQRKTIEGALAPVWEANHVWLIFVVVVLFTAFPPAFARIGIDLHVPVTLLLVAIVLRGAAFVFRQYGPAHQQRTWGWVFAGSSLTASVFLGIVLGTLTTGASWAGPFPLCVGALAATSFAFLASTYLTVESADPELREDFRRRALLLVALLALVAAITMLLAWYAAPDFSRDLLGAPQSLLLAAGPCLVALTAWSLRRRRFVLARAAAAATVAVLVSGWAFAHYPLLVAPDLTVAKAAAPRPTLAALVPVLLIGSAILLPSLWWLMRVFKSQSRGADE